MRERRRVKRFIVEVDAFRVKITNDWIFNLAGLLAYNLLMSSFSVLLVVLVVGGFVLKLLAPDRAASLETTIQQTLPGGGDLVMGAIGQLRESAGWLFAGVLVLAIFTGSRLFLTVENCLSVIFRLRGRHPVRQNLVAVGMLLLYALLIPIILLASVLPTTLVQVLGVSARDPRAAVALQVMGAGLAVVFACVLFGAIYLVVPNRRVRLRAVWRGTLSAAGLLLLFEAIFPFYVHAILRPSHYGTTIGILVAVLLFFYYLGFILLLGAEIDAWAEGHRESLGDIAAILYLAEVYRAQRRRKTLVTTPPDNTATAVPPTDDAPPAERAG